MIKNARTPLLLVGLFASAGGCTLIAGVDPDPLRNAEGGAGGSGADGGDGGVGAMGGTGGACADVSDCEDVGPCLELTCENGTCGADALAAGTECPTGMCDGEGACVECVLASDCPGANDVCQNGVCIPPQCRNGALDGNETGIDCGGGSCPPCPVDETCGTFSDCESGFCNNGTCALCSDSGDCQATASCDLGTGFCVEKLPLGAACVDGEQCQAGLCVDDVCCESACDGQCQACDLSGLMGTCSPVASGTADPACDPDLCGIGSACRCSDGATNGNETGQDCGGSDCDACVNGLGCQLATDCQSGFCDVNTCAPCTDTLDCQGNQFCNLGTGVCEGTLQNGDPCQTGGECVSGECHDSVCCNVDCSGTCMACDTGAVGTCASYIAGTDPEGECGADTCGATFDSCRCDDGTQNGQESDTDCGGPVCAACGNGDSCQTGADCATGYCPASVCAACTGSGQCDPGLFCDVGSGSCLPQLGQGDPCLFADECSSGSCADNVCCNEDCDGDCMACDTGTVGTCEGYAVGADPEGDCAPDVCGAAFGTCRCGDALPNGAETDVDCGGPVCGGCGLGDACNGPADCAGGMCTAGICGEAWINEVHYDNTGADQNEGVEIAGTAGLDLSGWQLLAYNGLDGSVYDTEALAGVIPDQQAGFGVVQFPIAGLQNGAPDGLALVSPSGLVAEFISYEGVVNAMAGAANGMASVDIVVSESDTTPLGVSLQRVGRLDAGPGPWQGPLLASPGQPNAILWETFDVDAGGFTDDGQTATWTLDLINGQWQIDSATGELGRLLSPSIDATGLSTVNVVLTASSTVSGGTNEVIVGATSFFSQGNAVATAEVIDVSSEAGNMIFDVELEATDDADWVVDEVIVTATN